MNKTLHIILTLLFLCVFTSCGGDNRSESNGEVTNNTVELVRIDISDIFLELKGRYAKEDRFKNNILKATGGSWVFLTTGISLYLFKKFSTTIAFDLPAYRNVNGMQVDPGYGLSGLITYNL